MYSGEVVPGTAAAVLGPLVQALERLRRQCRWWAAASPPVAAGSGGQG